MPGTELIPPYPQDLHMWIQPSGNWKYKRKIASALNMHRFFLLLIFPKHYIITTVYIVFILY